MKMKMQRLIKVLLIASSLTSLYFSCSSSTGPDEKKSSIRGKVLTPEGNPVEDAIIDLSYNTHQVSTMANDFSQMATIIIRYAVPTEGKVKLWITRKNSADTVITLVDEFKAAGSYQVIWNGRNEDDKYVISAVYNYHLEYGTIKQEKDVLYLRDYSNNDSIPSLEYFARTTNNGNFEITQDELPFGYQFLMTDAAGNVIETYGVTRQVTIWALHRDYSLVSVNNVSVDPEEGVEVTLQFQ
jgi:hypothetical protein